MATILNPYREMLGERNPQEVMAQTPIDLTKVAAVLSGKAELSYAPGKWTAREIICHLADCEIAFGFRLRQAIAEADHVIQPFDQNKWALAYGKADENAAVALFCSLRQWNIAFVQSQPPESLTKRVTHPERGAMTFETILQTMAGHDLNHLAQLHSIAGQ